MSVADSAKFFIAGQLAGMAQTFVGQPLDTVKVRLQTQTSASAIQYSSATDCLVKTVRNEGVFGLYKGMLSPMLGVGVCTAVLFTVYEGTMRQLVKPGEATPTYSRFVAGSVAGASYSVFAGPLELIKTQLQVKQGSRGDHQGTIRLASHIVQNHGVRMLFRGTLATVAREIPAYGAFYGVYHTAKVYLTPKGVEYVPAKAKVGAACLAGNAYWLSSYPFDVVKSRIQATDITVKSEGILSTFVNVYRNEGARAFVRGIGPCLLRSYPSATATFLTYEAVMDFFKVYWP